MAPMDDDGTGAEVGGIKDVAANLYNQAKGAIKDEASTAAGKLGIRAVKAGSQEAMKNAAIKKAVDKQKNEALSSLKLDAGLVVGGLLLGWLVFGRKGRG